MKCLKNCIFIRCSEIRTDLPCHCFISKKKVNLGETCPYENQTVTMLNMEAKKYHTWYENWQIDMEKHYSDKRKVITRRICE